MERSICVSIWAIAIASMERLSNWLLGFAIVLVVSGATANAQASQSGETRQVAPGTSVEASPQSNAQISAEQAQQPASHVNDKAGNIVGTILDQSGSVAIGASGRLSSEED